MTSRHRNKTLATVLAAAATLWCTAATAQAQATSNVRPAGTPAAAASQMPAQVPATTRVEPSATPATTAPATNAASREAAKAALEAPKPGQFRPSGPITVTAERADLVQGGYAIYSGHVVLSSNTLKMNGKRLELKQQASGQFTATLTGQPATLSHPSSGPDDPAVTAHANTLIFASATRLITLTGNARLTRGHNIVEGQTIRYNTADHRVQATGGNGGRVHMVIQPPPPALPPAPATGAQP